MTSLTIIKGTPGEFFLLVICLAASGYVRANLKRVFANLPTTILQHKKRFQLLTDFKIGQLTQQTTMSVSQVRQNYHSESEAGINRQINMELYASYCYQSMAFYFDRDDVALPGFSKFFKKSSEEEREHAEKFMKYQNKRGGRIVLQDIKKPERDEWGTGLDAMQVALQLEKSVNQALLELHKLCTSHEDAQMADFLESEYLEEQVRSIKEIGDHITNLKRVGPGLGEYMYDKESLGD